MEGCWVIHDVMRNNNSSLAVTLKEKTCSIIRTVPTFLYWWLSSRCCSLWTASKTMVPSRNSCSCRWWRIRCITVSSLSLKSCSTGKWKQFRGELMMRGKTGIIKVEWCWWCNKQWSQGLLFIFFLFFLYHINFGCIANAGIQVNSYIEDFGAAIYSTFVYMKANHAWTAKEEPPHNEKCITR